MSAPVPFIIAAVGAAMVLAYRAKAPAPGQAGALPTMPTTGVPEIDEIVIQGVPTELDVLARTIWAEARGEGYVGMQAVANVIMRRWRMRQEGRGYPSFGPVKATVRQICLAPNQFSAWREGDPNRSAALAVTPANMMFYVAQQIATKALFGHLDDVTYSADHYHTKAVKPSWAVASRVTTEVGAHVFYKLIA